MPGPVRSRQCTGVKLLLTHFSSRRTSAAALLLATALLGIYGIGRSLWLDEAWVANSVMEPSLSSMFYYPEWLQSTPPVFLLLVRAAVGIFGVSNAAFRIVPLALAVVGVAAMIAVSRRLMSAPFALLAAALLAFHPAAIEYSRTCKQYSAELAASAVILFALVLYFEETTPRRFLWIVCVFVIAVPLAWSSVFLLPGVVIAIWARSGVRRAGLLAVIVGGLLAVLYFAFIRQNIAPQLRAFWIATAKTPSPGLIAALIFCAAAALRAVYRRNWPQIAALLPCLLFAAADLLRLYPAEPRSRLFLLPCFLIAAAMTAEELFCWLIRMLPDRRRVLKLAGVLIALIVVGLGLDAGRKQLRDHRDLPEEDHEGAVSLLRRNVAPRDVVLVHASVLEGFRLYAAMEGWRDRHVVFGSTGGPCCARRNEMPKSSGAETVYADVDRMLPHGFSGRVWLLYSSRRTHWDYVGTDESKLWRTRLEQRGCAARGADIVLRGIAITALDCGGAR